MNTLKKESKNELNAHYCAAYFYQVYTEKNIRFYHNLISTALQSLAHKLYATHVTSTIDNQEINIYTGKSA